MDGSVLGGPAVAVLLIAPSKRVSNWYFVDAPINLDIDITNDRIIQPVITIMIMKNEDSSD